MHAPGSRLNFPSRLEGNARHLDPYLENRVVRHEFRYRQVGSRIEYALRLTTKMLYFIKKGRYINGTRMGSAIDRKLSEVATKWVASTTIQSLARRQQQNDCER